MTDSATEKLQKVLARAGLGSRRLMEQWIRDGRVRVDGQLATLGDRVGCDARISVDGRPLPARSLAGPERRVLIYHKPEGEVTTRSDPEHRPTVFERLPRVPKGRWIAVGRLDVNTSGLLLFTTDGELANRLMHPRYGLTREYAVRIFGEVTEAMRERLLSGVDLDDGIAAFEEIEVLSDTAGANDWYRVRLREGRRREVRRLWESQGVVVSRLMRIQYGPVHLPSGLRQGQHRLLPPGEVAALCRQVGLDPATGARAGGRKGRRSRGGGPRGGRQRR